jgi:hypothetical protein
MKKQIVTIVLGAVVMLGTATTLFAGSDCDVFHVGFPYCTSTSR